MKLSDVLNVFDMAAHANMVRDIAAGLLGKEPPLADDNKKRHISWGGLLGHDDEIGVMQRLDEFAKTDPEGRKIFLRFMEKKFPPGKTLPEIVAHKRAGNAFRSFVLNYGAARPRQYKVGERTTKTKDTETVEVQFGLLAPEQDDSLNFIKYCVKTIRDAMQAGKTEAQAHNILIRELRTMNVPTQSDAAGKMVKEVFETIDEATEEAATFLEKKAQEMYNNRNLIRRIIG